MQTTFMYVEKDTESRHTHICVGKGRNKKEREMIEDIHRKIDREKGLAEREREKSCICAQRKKERETRHCLHTDRESMYMCIYIYTYIYIYIEREREMSDARIHVYPHKQAER